MYFINRGVPASSENRQSVVKLEFPFSLHTGVVKHKPKPESPPTIIEIPQTSDSDSDDEYDVHDKLPDFNYCLYGNADLIKSKIEPQKAGRRILKMRE